jgi:hypothetical protein
MFDANESMETLQSSYLLCQMLLAKEEIIEEVTLRTKDALT